MSFKLFNIKIGVSFPFIALLTFFAFFDENGLGFFAICAAFLHESAHIAAAILCGCEIENIDFLAFGIKMRLLRPIEMLGLRIRLIILSAGCIANFVCFGAVTAICGRITAGAAAQLVVGIFNLLPAGTLDGGKIVYAFLSVNPQMEHIADVMCDLLSIVTALLFAVLGTFVVIKTCYNISLLITALYLIVAVLRRRKRLN